MGSRRARWFLLLCLLSFLILCAFVVSVAVGPAAIPFRSIPRILMEGGGTGEHSILLYIRIPRILLAFAVGGALSLAGTILQGMFRNPLVEPYTLGISGGASLGVCIVVVFRLQTFVGPMLVPAAGFLGAVLVVFSVYTLSLRKGMLKTQGMLLIGVMISFISSSLVMLMMAVSRTEDLHSIVFWIMGSLDEPNPFLVNVAAWGSVAGLLLSYPYSLDLNALALGEEEAVHLGVRVERTKRALFLIASLLAGVSVAVAGLIGFVGLVVPHLIRIFTGMDHRILFLGSFLAGGCFLILCDTFARTIIAPLELPVGVITGFIGGTIFIVALSKRRLAL
ncbi:MAG: iron ABC transporter permease [Deltaproteobacteria bacterium]|nr:iron ABC transporter permease [Deltaproteobacteria bacterium]